MCVAVDWDGWPIARDILPGNTADVEALRTMIDRFRKQFQIGRITVVADRGVMSRQTLTLLEKHAEAPFEYILGCRMRKQKVVRDGLLSRAGRYHICDENLRVKEVYVDGRRFIICFNPQEAARDAAAPTAMVDRLKEQLSGEGAKGLIGNRGYARFLKVSGRSIRLDEDAIEADARYDGKYVLTTNTLLKSDEVARCYKDLWRAERIFRETKHTLQVRPIFHQSDTQVVGPLVGAFLALRLEVDLACRLAQRGVDAPWPEVMRDLQQVRAVELKIGEETYRIRTDLAGHALAALQAAGVKPPPRGAPIRAL